MKTKRVSVIISGLGVCVSIAGMIIGLISATQNAKMICTTVLFSGHALICFGIVVMAIAELRRIGWRIMPVLIGVASYSLFVLFSCWAVSPETALNFLRYTHY